MFGRGTLSGAINYVTRRPGDEPYEGLVSVELGEHGHQQISGYANFRVNDWLAFSVNGKIYDFDGDFENTLGGDLNARSTDTISGAVFLDPTEDLSISARYIRAEDNDGHYAIGFQDSSSNNVFLDTRGYFQGTVSAPDSYAINIDDILHPGTIRESDRGLIEANWDIMGSGYDLTYQVGITEVYERTGADQTFDGTTALFFSPFVCANFITNCDFGVSGFNDTSAGLRTSLTNELRLSSPQDQAFRWRVGVFTSEETRKSTGEFLEITEFGPDGRGDRSEVENLAFFGGIEYDVNDQLTIGFELRTAEDEITNTGIQYNVAQVFDAATLAGLANPTQTVGNDTVRTETFDSTAPRLTIDYRMNEDVLFYGQYAEGNSPGGFNGTDAPQTTFDEEKLKSFEVGAKTSVWGFDQLNVAGFFNTFENQVLTNTFTTGSGGVDSFRANIGETEIFGLEVEFAKQITDNWAIYGSYGYLDAEITQGVDRDQAILRGSAPGGFSCSNLETGTPGPSTGFATCLEAGDITGNTPPLVSDHQAAIGTRYDILGLIDNVDLYVGGDVTYRSSFFAQVHNLAETGDATRVNLRAGADFGNISLQLWGKNVFDDDTPAGILRYVDFQAPRTAIGERPRGFAITPSAPTQWGATASVKF